MRRGLSRGRFAVAAAVLGLVWFWHSVLGAEAPKEPIQVDTSAKALWDAVHVFSSDEGLSNADVPTLNVAVSVLEDRYAQVVDHCIKALRANVGKDPKEMKPSAYAVRYSIRQLGNLSGYCRTHSQYSVAADAVMPFIAENFGAVEAWGKAEPVDKLQTEASRALPNFGVFGARAIVDWISQGKAGKDFSPEKKDVSYLPFLLAKTLEQALGGSHVTLEFLKIYVGPKPDPETPLARFCEYYRKLYSFSEKPK
jgi:hypothetical protein